MTKLKRFPVRLRPAEQAKTFDKCEACLIPVQSFRWAVHADTRNGRGIMAKARKKTDELGIYKGPIKLQWDGAAPAGREAIEEAVHDDIRVSLGGLSVPGDLLSHTVILDGKARVAVRGGIDAFVCHYQAAQA